MKITASDIARITEGGLYGPAELEVTELVTDSRLMSYSEGQAFFAIRGKNHDGHHFLASLWKSGVRVFVVEELPQDLGIFPGSAFISVQNTINAIQALAKHKRGYFNSPVIAITGSTGKTVVKEWLAEVIGQTMPVLRSPKSYNSQLGVPLSVWRLDKKYSMAIFEAGISQPGEMVRLKDVIRPDIGIITNVGDAHSENFPDIRQKAKEKLLLFRDCSTIIYCRDQAIINDLITSDEKLNPKELVGWSYKDPEAVAFVSKTDGINNSAIIKIIFKSQSHEFRIPFTDRASVENCVTVAVAALALRSDPAQIRTGLASLTSVAMRMEMKNGINNCQLIEDFYNSDPGSLGMALESLKTGSPRKMTLILSDFIQSGREETELYSEVADLVKRSGIDRFIGIGPALGRNRSFFDKASVFYLSTDEFIQKFSSSGFSGEMILLKGARRFEFEKIGRLLEQQIHQTVLEISLDAIASNLSEFRTRLNPGTRIMAMVKAFAYGAGPEETASLLEFHRVSYLGVAYADEGIGLRNAGVSVPVMVMNPDPASFDLIIRYNLEPELFSFRSLDSFLASAARHGLMGYPVHLKIDTGMHRLGFLPDEVPELCNRIRNNDLIRVMSVLSHFSASEDPAYDHFTHRQAQVFLSASGLIREALGYSFIRHICNSAGILRFPEYQFEMVRPGIGIYGIGATGNAGLRPAGRFITSISQIKKVPAGDPIGYGCRDVSESDRQIAIIPVGYADGLSRKLGNKKGSFFIRGKRVHIVGNICMDMCMADVSDAGAEEGDEVEIFGENISIEEIAATCDTIPYEILTSIPARVKRVFFRA